MAVFEDKQLILAPKIGHSHEVSNYLNFEFEMVFSKVKLIIKLALTVLFLQTYCTVYCKALR